MTRSDTANWHLIMCSIFWTVRLASTRLKKILRRGYNLDSTYKGTLLTIILQQQKNNIHDFWWTGMRIVGELRRYCAAWFDNQFGEQSRCQILYFRYRYSSHCLSSSRNHTVSQDLIPAMQNRQNCLDKQESLDGALRKAHHMVNKVGSIKEWQYHKLWEISWIMFTLF